VGYDGAVNRSWLCVLAMMFVLVLACGGSDGSGDGDAQDPTATLAAIGPTLPPVPTREAFPTPTPVAGHPEGTHTGVAVIDQVLDALDSGDPTALEPLLSFHPYRCDTAPAGTAGSNPCPPGVADGSAVDVIAIGECDVSYVASGRANLADEVRMFVAAASKQDVYAVTEVQEGRLASPLALRYLVILSGGYTMLLDDAGITHLGRQCDNVGPAQLYHPADRPILAPL
jgi:hypothetical protein